MQLSLPILLFALTISYVSAAFPIVAPKPKISYIDAYSLILKSRGMTHKESIDKGIVPYEINYTNLENSVRLKEFIGERKDKHAELLRKVTKDWGWFISVANHVAIEHRIEYFVSRDGTLTLITSYD